jgi:hypothetical protein
MSLLMCMYLGIDDKGGTMKIVKLITKVTHQSIVDAMISIVIAHGLTITNVENIMTDVIAYLKDNATVKK